MKFLGIIGPGSGSEKVIGSGSHRRRRVLGQPLMSARGGVLLRPGASVNGTWAAATLCYDVSLPTVLRLINGRNAHAHKGGRGALQGRIGCLLCWLGAVTGEGADGEE